MSILPSVRIFKEKLFLKLPGNYLLTSTEFAKHIQEAIDLYITCDRLDEASFKQKHHHPIEKNVVRRQNPLELVIRYIFTFDAQIPVIGSLMQDIDVGKKDLSSKRVSKAPNPIIDVELKMRLKVLKDCNKNRNNNFLPPPFFT